MCDLCPLFPPNPIGAERPPGPDGRPDGGGCHGDGGRGQDTRCGGDARRRVQLAGASAPLGERGEGKATDVWFNAS